MVNHHESGLGELLRHLTELLDRDAAASYREKGLNYRPRYTPIMRIIADGPCTISDLTTRLSITQGAVSQTVKLMEQDQLISRNNGPDARQTLISLTALGQSLLTVLQAHWKDTFRAIEELEGEIGVPLRVILSNAIAALEQCGFTDRIKAAGKRAGDK